MTSPDEIKFVSYTGRFPHLCSGVLSVLVNGVKFRFGYFFEDEEKSGPLLPPFWRSGGSAGVTESLDEFCNGGEWEMDDPKEEHYPPAVWSALPAILAAMNANVEHGCCGGCI